MTVLMGEDPANQLRYVNPDCKPGRFQNLGAPDGFQNYYAIVAPYTRNF